MHSRRVSHVEVLGDPISKVFGLLISHGKRTMTFAIAILTYGSGTEP